MMSQRFYLSAVVASVISITGQLAQAEPDLDEVVGTIARTILEQQQSAHERVLWDDVIANGLRLPIGNIWKLFRKVRMRRLRGINWYDSRQRRRQKSAQLKLRHVWALPERTVSVSSRGLRRAGFYTAGIDGVFGAGTRRAITTWQRANSFGQTGYLDARQLPVLRDRAEAPPNPQRLRQMFLPRRLHKQS